MNKVTDCETAFRLVLLLRRQLHLLLPCFCLVLILKSRLRSNGGLERLERTHSNHKRIKRRVALRLAIHLCLVVDVLDVGFENCGLFRRAAITLLTPRTLLQATLRRESTCRIELLTVKIC